MFPIQSPYNEFYLDVGDGHRLYVAEYGNPQGFPVTYLHGGPGAGNNPAWQAGFNPDAYRIILFDQRGCGKSAPFASLEQNTIAHLVDDIERLRQHLGIDRWTVGGGSWGSALAMLYTQKYPQSVTNMILRGTFFATKEGAAHIAEEHGTPPRGSAYYAAYRDYIPPEIRARDGLIRAYDRAMKNGTHEEQCEAAKRFMQWDCEIAFFYLEDAMPHIRAMEKDPASQIPITRIYMHYALHEFQDAFRQSLLNVPHFHDMPIDIVHGVDDRICSVENSYQMKAAYPHVTLHICEGAGHSGMDKGMQEATAQASEAARLFLGI